MIGTECSARAEGTSDRTTAATSRWSMAAAQALYDAPFADLLFQAHGVHRQHFDPNAVQRSRLLSIKTGGCPEDCGYCSQSARHQGGVAATKLMEVDEVVAEARKARDAGATRYCMGAAWRGPKERDMQRLAAMIGAVKALGLETCMTLGMLKPNEASSWRRQASITTTTISTLRERYYEQDGDDTRVAADRLDTCSTCAKRE